MSVSKLPSGRYRAQVYDERSGKTISAAKVLGLDEPTFSTKREAEDAVTDARRRLHGQPAKAEEDVTVKAFRERWLAELRLRDGEEALESSTLTSYQWRTRGFTEQYGTYLVRDISAGIARDWIAGTEDPRTPHKPRRWQRTALSLLFSAALDLGLIAANPFARLGAKKKKGKAGNRYVEPPTEEQAARLRELAWHGMHEEGYRLCPPGFAGWLQFAMFSGMRPGEVDALRWTNVDLKAGEVHVRSYLSPISGLFTLPKNGRTRVVALLPEAREALLAMWEQRRANDDFVFVNTRGTHFQSPGRYTYWNRLRTRVGGNWSLYLATRHFCGWLLYEQRGVDSEDVALFLGHTDGGDLVRTLYGHRSPAGANTRILQASGLADAGAHAA